MAEMDEMQIRTDEAGTDWLKIAMSLLGLVAVFVGLVGGLYWFKLNRMQSTLPSTPIAAAPAASIISVPTVSAPPPEPTPRHPLEQPAPTIALTLESSDATMFAELSRLSGIHGLYGWIRPSNIVRHIVATVDVLPRRRVPPQVLPTTPIPGGLIVSRVDDSDVISANNAERYLPWLHILTSIDASSAATSYRHFYPLFQQAYRQLGYPKRYFNDRLIEAIDNILATPDITTPPRVVSPGVMWQYVDPDLETLSAGQKVLLRMGESNATVVRSWVKVFRANIS